MINRLLTSPRNLFISWSPPGHSDRGCIYISNKDKYICTLIFYNDTIVVHETKFSINRDKNESDYYKVEEYVNYQIP